MQVIVGGIRLKCLRLIRVIKDSYALIFVILMMTMFWRARFRPRGQHCLFASFECRLLFLSLFSFSVQLL